MIHLREGRRIPHHRGEDAASTPANADAPNASSASGHNLETTAEVPAADEDVEMGKGVRPLPLLQTKKMLLPLLQIKTVPLPLVPPKHQDKVGTR